MKNASFSSFSRTKVPFSIWFNEAVLPKIRLGLNEFIQKFLVELHRDSGLFSTKFWLLLGGSVQ